MADRAATGGGFLGLVDACDLQLCYRVSVYPRGTENQDGAYARRALTVKPSALRETVLREVQASWDGHEGLVVQVERDPSGDPAADHRYVQREPKTPHTMTLRREPNPDPRQRDNPARRVWRWR